MGKLYGFNSIFAVKQRGAGAEFDDVYFGGTDPNQEGGILTRGRAGVDVPGYESVMTEEPLVSLPPIDKLAAAAAAAEPVASTSRRGGMPTPPPPPPVRGARLYRGETHLQKTLNMIKNLKEGKRTRVHGRVLG